MPVLLTLIRRVVTRSRLPLGGLRLAAVTLLAFSTWAGLVWPTAATAAARGAPLAVTLAVHAGFDGYYKDQRWLPVRITVANDGPDTKGTLSVAVPRSNGGADVVVTRDVDLPTQSRREVFLYVPTEGFISNLQVTLTDGNRKDLATAATRLVQAGASDLIYGVLASSPSAFNVLGGIKPASGSAYVAQLETADLPPVSYAWHALDVLVISDVDTGVFSPEQRTALAEWVASGGRLIVAGGPTWQKTAAGLGPLLPVAPSGSQNLPDTSALAAVCSAANPPAGSSVAPTRSH
jgi:hypothetical protein